MINWGRKVGETYGISLGSGRFGNAPVVTEIIPISRPSVPCLLSPVGSDTLKFISCANPCVQKVLY